MGNWSELPSEIIHSISMRIDNLFDLIHFRSVCSFWRSSSLLKLRPMRALRCTHPVPNPRGHVDVCHISSSRVYLVKSYSDHNGPPRYWLFKLGEKENGDIVLHHLFQRRYYTCVNPPFSLDLLRCQVFELAQEHVAWHTWTDRSQTLYKKEEYIGFMSLDADNNEYMVLGNFLFTDPAVYRSISERWTKLQIPEHYANLQGIVSHKSKFYAVDGTGRTIVVEPTLQVTTFQQSRPCGKARKHWLLKSGDKVLLVEMCTKREAVLSRPDIREKKIWFEVSELDVERNDWNQVEDLDGRVLFLEQFCSFSCLATEIPGFRSNSIIFPYLWGRTNSNEHKSILVYEFNKKGVRSVEDIPEYSELFPSPTTWVISNA